MTAAAQITQAKPIATLEDFSECAAFYGWCWQVGILEKPVAVDCAQRHADLWGLVDAFGQDEIQRIMSWAFAPIAEHAPC
jgi:GAF domain-containing protein